MKYGPISAASSAMINAIDNPSSVVCTGCSLKARSAAHLARHEAELRQYRDNYGEVTACDITSSRTPLPAGGVLRQVRSKRRRSGSRRDTGRDRGAQVAAGAGPHRSGFAPDAIAPVTALGLPATPSISRGVTSADGDAEYKASV